MSPNNGGKTHLRGNASNTVIDVSVRRSESVRRDTNGVLDNLHSPSKLGDNLLVGERGKRSVGPGVDGDLVTSGVFRLEHLRSGKDSRTDDEEGRLDVLLVQVVEQDGGVRRWSVIVRKTPGKLVGALSDIGFSG